MASEELREKFCKTFAGAIKRKGADKLLSLRYLDQAEWVKVAMEIGYSVDYTQKELRKKSLDLAAECLFPLIGLVDYD